MIDWDNINYTTVNKSLFGNSFNDDNSILTLNSEDTMPVNKSNELIGMAMKNLESNINQLLVFAVLHQYMIGIQLTPRLKVIVEQDKFSTYVHYKYSVIYNDDQELFNFHVKRYVSSEKEYVFKLVINVFDTEIETKYENQFFDDDAKYLMQEFPYYFKVIKYVLNLFLKRLGGKIGVIYPTNLFTNDDPFFMDEAIDDEDQKMKDILHNIYGSVISGNFKTSEYHEQ